MPCADVGMDVVNPVVGLAWFPSKFGEVAYAGGTCVVDIPCNMLDMLVASVPMA